MLDIMMLSGKRTSRLVGGSYVGIVQYAPWFFNMLYKAGGKISSARRRSPVYYTNALMAKHLYRYLEDNEFDVIVTPHLFAAETLTFMKQKGLLRQKTVSVITDYTCIPFWEETNCDWYILPHEDLIGEYVLRGLPPRKLLPYGIPVRPAFLEETDAIEAKRQCGLSPEGRAYLVMGGSMGFGEIQLFVTELAHIKTAEESIVILCGNNLQLENKLRRMFARVHGIRVLGFTNQVSLYMDACDVVFTKPGGLTSTEAAVKQIPIVHTKPIPGCETANLQFFTARGMSVTADGIEKQAALGRELLRSTEKAKRMKQSQAKNSKPQASLQIVRLLERITQKPGVETEDDKL